MLDWYSIASKDVSYQIEWSPNGGMNLRAKYKNEEHWRYAECEKVKYALSIGEQLLVRGKKEKDYSLQPWYEFIFRN